MSIYKVLISCSRMVPVNSGSYAYMEEQRAYAEYQYFSSLEKAQAFAQRYSEVPLVWDHIGDDWCWGAKTAAFEATIYKEEGAYFDTTLLPPLPTKFASRHGFLGD